MTELLAPVGTREALSAAIEAGADSVYFGVKGLNLRTGGRADFSLEELPELVKQCHDKGVKAYLTVNVVTYDEEQERIRKTLLKAKEANIDAIICWDFAVIKQCQELKLPIHLSTQASISNYEALKHYVQQGAKAVVLARELTLPQIKNIIRRRDEDQLPVKIETFIHGAMCIAISGRCFMSQIAQCKSANRGECLQLCRRSYVIKDEEEGTEFKLENNYVMSPKDLCALPILDKILEAKIDILKIEGRGRSPEYVSVVVKTYREAIKRYHENQLDEKSKNKLQERMERVYNKGFSTGFYNGIPFHEWAGTYGSKATTKKEYVGKITNYYAKAEVAEAKIESASISEKDEYYIIGKTTGVKEGTMPEIWLEEKKIPTATKGMNITFKQQQVRIGDKLYKITPRDNKHKNKND